MATPGQRLRDLIRSTGPISFARFMDEALYGSGGYYVQIEPPMGRDGDFVTGSSFSPLFGRSTSVLVQRLDGLLGRPADLFEAGFGSGDHLRAVADALGRGGGRRLMGWDRAPREAPAGVSRVRSLGEVSGGEIQGLVFSYELFDALPFQRLIGRAGAVAGELLVRLSPREEFEFVEEEVSDRDLLFLLANMGRDLEQGQIADLSPGWRPLYRQLAERLGRGLLVTFDYGYETHRLLDPRVRFHGTLACYSRQRVHRNPFVDVGKQDLTAHIDFGALRQEGESAGLETVVLTRQARWLMACGLFDHLQDTDPAVRLEAMTLLDPEGMGEDIRVLIQSRGVDAKGLFDMELLAPSRTRRAP